jgi:hypothetical protein
MDVRKSAEVVNATMYMKSEYDVHVELSRSMFMFKSEHFQYSLTFDLTMHIWCQTKESMDIQFKKCIQFVFKWDNAHVRKFIRFVIVWDN